MVKEHLAWITEIYRFVFWPLIVLGFAFCREPNVRWALLIFGLLNLSGTLLSQVIRPLGAVYGWLYHVAMALLCLAAVKAFVIFRPVISLWVGSALARVPWIGFLLSGLLPATYRAKLYPEELALRRLCMVYVMTHSLVLLHYVMHWCGAMRPGGLYERIGLYKRALFDASFTIHLIIMMLELMLLALLVAKGLKARLVMKA